MAAIPPTGSRRPDDESPNVELVRRMGWAVKHAAGKYCVAWRGADEVLFVWRDGRWVRAGDLPAGLPAAA